MGVRAGASPLPGSDNLLLDEGRALLVPAPRCPEGRRGSCSWRRQRPTDAMAEASHRGSARCSLPSHLANTAAAPALASSIAPLQTDLSKASSSSLLYTHFIPQDTDFQEDNQLQSKAKAAQLPGVQGTRSLQPASLGTGNTTSLRPIYKGSSSSTLKLFFKKQ